MRGLIIFILTLFLFTVLSCSEQTVDKNQLHNEVLSVLDDYQKAHETQNVELLRECFSPNPDIIILGTDEKELWVDRESLLAEQKRFYGTVDEIILSIRDKVVKMCGTGKSAWFYLRVNWHVNSGDNKYTLDNIRTTGVMNKENDRWGIVMMHTSMPVKGQVVQY